MKIYNNSTFNGFLSVFCGLKGASYERRNNRIEYKRYHRFS